MLKLGFGNQLLARNIMSLFEQAQQYFKLSDRRIVGKFNFNNKCAVLLVKDQRPGFAALYLYKIADHWFDKDTMDRCLDYIFKQLKLTTLICFVRKGSNADRLCLLNRLDLIRETQYYRTYHLTADHIASIQSNY